MKTPAPITSSRDIRAYYRGFEDALRLNAQKEGRTLYIAGKKLADVLNDLKEAKKLALANANDEKDKFAIIHEVNKLGVAVGYVRSYSEEGKVYLLGYKPETQDVSCTCRNFETLNPRYPNSPPNFPKINQRDRFCKHLKDFAHELLEMANEGCLDQPRQLGSNAS